METGGKMENGNGNIGNIGNGELEIPKPEGNKGTQSSDAFQSPISTFQSPISTFQSAISNISNGLRLENGNENNLRLENLSSEQLATLGMIRDLSGEVFRVTNLKDGGYQLYHVSSGDVACAQ